MSGFVDPRDPVAVEQVIAAALTALGPAAALAQLSALLPVRSGRPGRLFRQEQPMTIQVGEEALSLPSRGKPTLQHVVGGVVLSRDEVVPRALPGVLASFVVRALEESGSHDDAAVLLTSLRDAVDAGR